MTVNFITELTGSIAAFLTTISFLPQAIKTIKTRDTQSISLLMYLLFTIGVFFWTLYGIFLSVWIIVIANVVTLVFSGAILTIKIHNCWKVKK